MGLAMKKSGLDILIALGICVAGANLAACSGQKNVTATGPGAAAGSNGAAAPALPRNDKADVIAAENAFTKAMKQGDAATVDHLMEAQYAGSGSSGSVHDKAYWMQSLRSGKTKASPKSVRALTDRELHVTISGDNALVLGDDRETTWLDVWVRHPDGWKILASHRAFRQ